MQATETSLRRLVEGTRQYVVPLFQRPYSWKEKQWKTLWTDVLDKARYEDGRPHFFGSIVTAQAKSVPQGVGKYLLIDGQQRLTTIQLLLAAVRDVAGRSGNAKLRDRIDGDYLTNKHEEGEERLKVLPTQSDRGAFGAIIRQEEGPKSILSGCYQYFASRLERLDADQLEAVHKAIVDRFSLVSILCDEHDNPHLIFESLNAKGEKLTPADLIRNFLLMRVHVAEQDRLFKMYWEPIQDALKDDLTEFVRHYLMKEGRILKEAEVYFELKDRLSNSTPVQAEAFLKDLHRHGLYYASFIGVRRDADDELTQKLDRIRRLKVTVAYPFLLRVFDAENAGSLSRSQVFQTLDLLEAFVIRRAICNFPTNQLRRMLPPVFDAAGGAGPSFIDGLRRELGGSRCPDDATFAASLVTEPLYSGTEKNVRLRIILERLERSFNHKEPVQLAAATIEHVLPQEMTSDWELELGDDAAGHAEQLLHTLGNLTLTGYNGELSNKPYGVKRAELLKSHLELNRCFAEVEQWTPDAIRARGRSLAQRALKIWEDVGRSPRPSELKKPSNVRPVKVRFRDVEEPVANWKDAFVKLLIQFEAANPGLLHRLATKEAMNSVLGVAGDEFPRSKVLIGQTYVNTHASAVQLQKWCRKIAEKGQFEPTEFEFITSSPEPTAESAG